jgi:hypothetical protein
MLKFTKDHAMGRDIGRFAPKPPGFAVARQSGF